jgi:hypothetical protein
VKIWRPNAERAPAAVLLVGPLLLASTPDLGPWTARQYRTIVVP